MSVCQRRRRDRRGRARETETGPMYKEDDEAGGRQAGTTTAEEQDIQHTKQL